MKWIYPKDGKIKRGDFVKLFGGWEKADNSVIGMPIGDKELWKPGEVRRPVKSKEKSK
jgi:hypothetical protein